MKCYESTAPYDIKPHDSGSEEKLTSSMISCKQLNASRVLRQRLTREKSTHPRNFQKTKKNYLENTEYLQSRGNILT